MSKQYALGALVLFEGGDYIVVEMTPDGESVKIENEKTQGQLWTWPNNLRPRKVNDPKKAASLMSKPNRFEEELARLQGELDALRRNKNFLHEQYDATESQLDDALLQKERLRRRIWRYRLLIKRLLGVKE